MKSISPITTLGAEDLAITGSTRIEDVLNSLPQVTGAQSTGTIGSAGTGTATVNLRNLGEQRTLVLIDGQRLAPGGYFPGNNASASAADLNLIPQALVSHIDVLTGGASAVYGADAVAGVVNFVMKDDFTGLRLTATRSGFEHGQQNSLVQGVVTAAGQPLPSGTVYDGGTADVNLVAGASFADGRGNIEVYAGYRNIAGVLEGERDYGSCTLSPGTGGTLYGCGGSSTTYPGRFKVGTKSYSVDASGNFVPYTLSFNYGPYDWYQRPDERYTTGTFVHYDMSPHMRIYGEFNFMEDLTTQQISPTGYMYGSGPGPTGGYYVNCNNPLLSAGQLSTVCGAQAGTTNLVEVGIGRRNVEGGDRDFYQKHLELRSLVGIKGDFGDEGNWHYNASFSYSRTQFQETYENDWLTTNAAAALQAVTDPATGQIVCSGNQNGGNAHPGCVPYNVWKAGAASAAAIAYLETPFRFRSTATQQVASASINGNLGKYGIQSPFASDGVAVALGGEFRRNTLNFFPDANLQAGLDANRAGVTIYPIPNASYNVWEIFPELRIPIVDHKPGFYSLDAELGYRYSNYSVGFDTSTWKVGLAWSPIRALRLRGEINRAVRVPNLAELYGSRYVGYDGKTDPCSGTTPSATATQCANTGVTAAEYGHIDANQANQYNGFIGGNPTLSPEVSTTKSLGAVFTPGGGLRGLIGTVDFYDIKISNLISQLGADYILGRCLYANTYCGLVHRAPGTGSLFEGTQGYITDTLLNTGSLQERGIDFAVSQRFDLGRAGRLGVDFTGTYLLNLITSNDGSTSYDAAGLYGLVVGQPNPIWRHRFRVTWDTPVKGLSANATWRHIDPVDLDAASSQTALANKALLIPADLHLSSVNYVDLGFSIAIDRKKSFRVGVNNVLDRDPPIVSSSNISSTAGNGNTFAQIYDSLGRYLFASIDVGF